MGGLKSCGEFWDIRYLEMGNEIEEKNFRGMCVCMFEANIIFLNL